ncbi:hypothetical protein GCM10029963_24910 [Micromonospora andamanensis]|uniref:Uncharacterized protein n=1 Tax=Micromonospora andamanensis TaxID=1287068 RepID=A0ABQ4I3N9_9ACTN|nr:hypothetical protein Van01_57330 [Micromonospora andamanensis]GIJ41996.1 hypothetical protein Vwe01_53210 [Micromonospora andamanensis]
MPTKTNTGATVAGTAVRFTNAQSAALIVCTPVRITPGVLAHRSSRTVLGTAEGNPTGGGRLVFTADRSWATTPVCRADPAPADPHAGRGWCEVSAGWAEHLGALACPTCFCRLGPWRADADNHQFVLRCRRFVVGCRAGTGGAGADGREPLAARGGDAQHQPP